jgi:pimeloyl-ACP methyl ester carboxylesterase
MKRRSRLSAVLALLLLAGCRAAAWRENHYSEPVEYYFRYPETVGAQPPRLFVALLGEDRSPLDCIELFAPSADERDDALLCPDLGGEGGLADRPQAEADLAAILTELYSQYQFQDKFYLAGFGDGGEFALEYGFKYPTSVSGISAMSVDNYPEAPASSLPVLIVVGEADETRLAPAQEMEQAWRELGVLVRLLTVNGDGDAPTRDFARLASERSTQIR